MIGRPAPSVLDRERARGRSRVSRITEEKTAPEILAHFLAQNAPDYAQMMPFYPTNTAVNR